MTAYVKKAESKGRFVLVLGGRAPFSELSSFTQALLSEPVDFKIEN